MVGATYPQELADVRRLVGDDMIFLVPGLGAQGGSVEDFVKAGLNSLGNGVIINSSRSIIYASSAEDFAEKARTEAIKSNTEINKFRTKII
jgi:orotidine-5'-phosphate decarboxylase